MRGLLPARRVRKDPKRVLLTPTSAAEPYQEETHNWETPSEDIKLWKQMQHKQNIRQEQL